MARIYLHHDCPNCGAGLKVTEGAGGYETCSSCGSVLEDQASPEERAAGVSRMEITGQLSDAELDALRRAGRGAGRALGVGMGVLVLGVTAAVVFASVGSDLASIAPVVGGAQDDDGSAESAGGGVPQFYSFGPSAMLASDDDTSPDFVGVANGPGRPQLLYVDFDADPGLRWTAEVSDDASGVYNQVLADETRVYFSWPGHVTAYNRGLGTVIWEAALSDEIQHNICPGCFQLFGDAIATLSVDGTLEVWDAATGGSRWQRSLVETPRQIVNLGGNPAVLDRVGEEIELQVFDLIDGEVREQLPLGCPNPSFPGTRDAVGPYDPLLAAPDGSSLFYIGGFFGACAQRWDVAPATLAWETAFSRQPGLHLELEELVLTDASVLFAVGGALFSADRGSGEVRTLLEVEDHELFPIGAADGVLTVRAKKTRGTSTWELWGVDTERGNVKWTFAPEAADLFDLPSHPLDSDGAWIAGLTGGGLTVAQLYDEPGRLVLQTIPLQSGTASAPITVDLPGTGALWTRVLGWRGNELRLLVDTTMRVIDVTSGNVSARWP